MKWAYNGLIHSKDRFSIMHPNYWSWLNTLDEMTLKVVMLIIQGKNLPLFVNI